MTELLSRGTIAALEDCLYNSKLHLPARSSAGSVTSETWGTLEDASSCVETGIMAIGLGTQENSSSSSRLHLVDNKSASASMSNSSSTSDSSRFKGVIVVDVESLDDEEVLC